MKLWQQSVVEGRYVMSYELSSTQWRQVESFLPGRPGWVGVTAKDNRTFVNGVLWVLRSGAQWKDLPPGYGNWKSVHKRFTRWARAGSVTTIGSGRGSSKCCRTTRTTDT